MIDPDGGRFTYSYDAVNRIEYLVNPWNERTSYSYDAAGRRTMKKLANGTRASFTYDAADRLTELYNLKSDASVISSFEYVYDNSGNQMHVVQAQLPEREEDQEGDRSDAILNGKETSRRRRRKKTKK